MEEKKISKKAFITLIVFTVVLGIMAITFCVLYAVNAQKLEQKSIDVENIYQRTFYDLVDDINNTELKLSKLLASQDIEYSNNLLDEIEKNLQSAQNELSYLPISINGIPETTKFINMFSGYTDTLKKKTKNGKVFSAEEINTLRMLRNSVYGIKLRLNKMSEKFSSGYKISDNILNDKTDFNAFTLDMQQIKAPNQKYPTMIYDGPFSESTLNKKIKGLNFDEISKEDAEKEVRKIFKDASQVKFSTEINGKIESYGFDVVNKNLKQFVQITKKGGKLLSLSAMKKNATKNISEKEAIKIAEDFALKLGIKNMKCVWNTTLETDTYINLAPIIDNVVIYPDLIKVKVDLSTGEIIGFEASEYYTNHTERNLPKAKISKSTAENNLDKKYKVQNSRLALSPIEYKGEILTYEFECTYQGSTYYIYINASTGLEENILRVIETDNGNLLM